MPRWIIGAHNSVAYGVARIRPWLPLCAAFGGPPVSTPRHPQPGLPAVRMLDALESALPARLDGVADGQTGLLDQPTPIRAARSGKPLRC